MPTSMLTKLMSGLNNNPTPIFQGAEKTHRPPKDNDVTPG